MKTTLIVGALAALCVTSGAIAAGPAVSSINGKVSVEGGNFDGHGGALAAGSLSLPVGHAFGVQLDAAAGSVHSTSAGGFGVHAFWRDPDRALFGLTASSSRLEHADTRRVGVEGEAYFQNVTVRSRVGHQDGDGKNGNYFNLGARWYITPNMMVSVGGERVVERNFGRIGAEWQVNTPSMPGLALYLDAAKGEKHYDAVVVGVRYYFGETKSLVQRHRRDDPDSLLGESISARGAPAPVRAATVTAPALPVGGCSACAI